METLVERGDQAIIAKTKDGTIVGYALLTEHLNTWTGMREGFAYALHLEQVEERSLVDELLEAIQIWGTTHRHPVLRAEINERQLSTALIKHMEAKGWCTSGSTAISRSIKQVTIPPERDLQPLWNATGSGK